MDLEPNSDEQQVIDAARTFLSKALPVSRLRGEGEGRFESSLRAELAALGWYGLGLDEESGGFGLTVVDEMLVFREIGRHLGPVAVLGISLAAKLAAAGGLTELAASLVAGERSVAIAVKDPNLAGWRLFDFHDAELAVLLDAGETRLVPLAGIAVASLPCLDKSVTMGLAELDGAETLARDASGAIERTGRLMTAAMLIGICEAVTDMIAEYAKIRETFGRPIGAYQAVRHPIAEMAVRTFGARAQLFLAAVSDRDGRPDAALQVDAAKALANEAALINVEENIQLHGGIAVTDEHDAHLYLKRANLLVRLLGDRLVLDRILVTPIAA